MSANVSFFFSFFLQVCDKTDIVALCTQHFYPGPLVQLDTQLKIPFESEYFFSILICGMQPPRAMTTEN